MGHTQSWWLNSAKSKWYISWGWKIIKIEIWAKQLNFIARKSIDNSEIFILQTI